uniref:SOWAHA-C winged helix-turn-helix domain-containing protein n=1 Tax=Tetraodon nigroviridis TaxID=99883 RepID=H3C737_TETNG
MAAGLSRDAVLLYLQSRGGSVRNAELLQRFRGYIREDPDRDRNRELFKRFVNSLATVQQVDGVSYVVLRKKFRGKTPASAAHAGSRPPHGDHTCDQRCRTGSACSSSLQRADPREADWAQPPSRDPRGPGPPAGPGQPPSRDPRGPGPPAGPGQPPSRDPRGPGPPAGPGQPPSRDPRGPGPPAGPGGQPFGGVGKAPPPPSTASPAPSSPSSSSSESPQSLVPLEAREHAWLVKGAAGAWPDIYSLFREDSSLLNRKDFISGFTVLHWIAKHGDHRVLNTLWYGVEKAGLTFDVNARSTSGHTPLHIAAIHGHKNIIRLLVRKFNADVRLRDTAGKKAWHYL